MKTALQILLENGIASTGGYARRLIAQRWIKFDDNIVISPDQIFSNVNYVSVGKKEWVVGMAHKEVEQESDLNQQKYDEKYKILLQLLKDFGSSALQLGMDLRQDQLNGYATKSGNDTFDEWFQIAISKIPKEIINKILL